MEKKVITILFSRYHTFMANFLHIVSGRGYTHASIALDEDDEYFYSFNSKGFRKEYPKKHKNRNAKCVGFQKRLMKELKQLLKNLKQKKINFIIPTWVFSVAFFRFHIKNRTDIFVHSL